MNRKNMQNYQMLTRTVEFAANHLGLFPKNSAAAEILDTMKSGVSQLSEKGSARVSAESAMRISRNARTAAREKLQGCLATADRIARLLRSDKIRFPAARTEQALIDSGHAFAADAESMATGRRATSLRLTRRICTPGSTACVSSSMTPPSVAVVRWAKQGLPNAA